MDDACHLGWLCVGVGVNKLLRDGIGGIDDE